MGNNHLTYICEPAVSWFLEDQIEADEVSFLFCDLSLLDINNIQANQLNLIGCFLGEGAISNCKLETLHIQYCAQIPETKAELGLSEINAVEVKNSFVTLTGHEATSEKLSTEENINQQLQSTFLPFYSTFQQLTDADLEAISQLLHRFPDHSLLTYLASMWLLSHEESTGEHFLPHLLPRIKNLPEDQHSYFQTLFEYLINDGYQYPLASQELMATPTLYGGSPA